MKNNKLNCEKLENQLIRFPKWKHNDCADNLQMIYYLSEAEPQNNTKNNYKIPDIKFDSFGFVDI